MISNKEFMFNKSALQKTIKGILHTKVEDTQTENAETN
jgi:hypothetical protein